MKKQKAGKPRLSDREKLIAECAYHIGFTAADYPFHGVPTANEIFNECLLAPSLKKEGVK